LVEHLLAALKPVERLAIDLLYLQGRSVERFVKSPAERGASLKCGRFERDKK